MEEALVISLLDLSSTQSGSAFRIRLIPVLHEWEGTYWRVKSIFLYFQASYLEKYLYLEYYWPWFSSWQEGQDLRPVIAVSDQFALISAHHQLCQFLLQRLNVPKNSFAPFSNCALFYCSPSCSNCDKDHSRKELCQGSMWQAFVFLSYGNNFGTFLLHRKFCLCAGNLLFCLEFYSRTRRTFWSLPLVFVFYQF